MIEIVLIVLGAYLGVGLLFALVFQAVGLARVDPAVGGAGLLFRLLITPGLAALWPLVAVKWRRAAAGGEPFGHPARPLSPRGVRALHGVLAVAVAVTVPALAIVGVALRPGVSEEPGAATVLAALDPAPFGEVVRREAAPFEGLPVVLALRHGEGRGQLELEVARDLEIPALGLFWLPAGAASPGDPSPKAKSPAAGVFLGAVWGPGTRRFTLPEGAEGGSLLLYSLAHREAVASFDL